MNKYRKHFWIVALAATLTIATLSGAAANASSQGSTSKLLTANFDRRKVVKIEAGYSHFVPGQVAPIHTHTAPAPI